MRPFGWLGPSLGRSSPGSSAEGRVPQLLPPPSGPPPPQPRGPKPTRVPANPTKLPLKLTVWCRVRQTGATLGARGVPASHAALYATRLQWPPSAPRFSPPGPGSHGAGALLSRLYRAADRGGGQRGALGQLRASGAPGPIRQTGEQKQCTSVVGCQKPSKVTSPSADLITLKEVPAPK